MATLLGMHVFKNGRLTVINFMKKGPLHKFVRNYRDYIRYSQEVKAALATKKPVVSLESTIITHGMPFPENLHTAAMVEEVVRENGAVPATIAVLDGKMHIGLQEKEMMRLAQSDKHVIKTSRRDLPFVLSQGLTGGTTVSGTMIASERAGIPVFVTGGIGGVHRGAEASFDVSTDLTELGRTQLCVISAGVKSILDIPKTLEYLETQGVCVGTFGKSKSFPAFFTRDSGVEAPYLFSDALQAAKVLNAMLNLKLHSGMLVAVPIPEEHAAEGVIIEDAIQRALFQAQENDIVGKEVTPFVLQRVNELTSGKSLQANIALIKNNAAVGASIACELSALRNQWSDNYVGQSSFRYAGSVNTGNKRNLSEEHVSMSNKRPIIIGGTNVDFTCTFQIEDIEHQTSCDPQEIEERLNNFLPEPKGGTYPGTVLESFGGVGRNIADCLTRLGQSPLFISAIGGDMHADNFLHHCQRMDVSGVCRSSTHTTACYSAIFRQTGELLYGIGDFDVHTEITPDYVSRYERALASAPLVCVDGNIPTDTLAYICDICHQHQVPVWFEPADFRYIKKIFENSVWEKLTYVSPNLNELRQLHQHITGDEPVRQSDSDISDVIQEAVSLVQPVLPHIPNIMLTLGKNGVLMCRNSKAEDLFPVKGLEQEADGNGSYVHYPVRRAGQGLASIVSVSGAGDCLVANVIAMILRHEKPFHCITAGLLASQLSLKSHMAVPNTISPQALSKKEVEKWVNMYCVPKHYSP